MKTSRRSRKNSKAGRPSSSVAFTYSELMVSMALILFVLSAIIASHLFGLRMFEITKSKLGASDEARAALANLVTEVRSAKILRVGNGNRTSFTEAAPNRPQTGSAIQIYPTTDTNTYVRYFWDSTDSKLKRTASGTNSVSVVAHSITNQLVFTSEDYTGNVLTNNENNRVIGLTLQFYQLEYPSVAIGPGNYFDSYQLRTKITRRTLE